MFLRVLTTVVDDHNDRSMVGTYDAQLGYRVFADGTAVVCGDTGSGTATLTHAERDRDDRRGPATLLGTETRQAGRDRDEPVAWHPGLLTKTAGGRDSDETRPGRPRR